MKQLIFFAPIFTVLLAISCGQKPEAQAETSSATPPINVNALPQAIPPGDSIQPITTATVAPQTNAVPTKTAATGAGLNPEHGQPGHRCEIAVGAPLNSKPTTVTTPPTITTSAPTITPAPVISTPTVSSLPSPTVTTTPAPAQPVAPGMNPAHGQPGHRCEIAVGAPLNSTPAKKQ